MQDALRRFVADMAALQQTVSAVGLAVALGLLLLFGLLAVLAARGRARRAVRCACLFVLSRRARFVDFSPVEQERERERSESNG